MNVYGYFIGICSDKTGDSTAVISKRMQSKSRDEVKRHSYGTSNIMAYYRQLLPCKYPRVLDLRQFNLTTFHISSVINCIPRGLLFATISPYLQFCIGIGLRIGFYILHEHIPITYRYMSVPLHAVAYVTQ